jgi:hypothetical protein
VTEHKILITGNGLGHGFEVDGRDIARLVTGADIRIEGDASPVVRLALVVPPADFVLNSAATVTLDDETAELLKLLGWTPPEASL